MSDVPGEGGQARLTDTAARLAAATEKFYAAKAVSDAANARMSASSSAGGSATLSSPPTPSSGVAPRAFPSSVREQAVSTTSLPRTQGAAAKVAYGKTPTKQPVEMSYKAGFVVIAMVTLIIGYLMVKSPGHPAHDQGAAISDCESAITPQLSSPATAHFHNINAQNGSGNSIAVTGDVDSDNDFGALLTTSWTCYTDATGNVTSAGLG